MPDCRYNCPRGGVKEEDKEQGMSCAVLSTVDGECALACGTMEDSKNVTLNIKDPSGQISNNPAEPLCWTILSTALNS